MILAIQIFGGVVLAGFVLAAILSGAPEDPPSGMSRDEYDAIRGRTRQ